VSASQRSLVSSGESPDGFEEIAMLDDLRRHDPTPTAEEKSWMDCDLIAVGALAATAIALAAILAFSGPEATDNPHAVPQITAAASTR
jgi:hypothetical protein